MSINQQKLSQYLSLIFIVMIAWLWLQFLLDKNSHSTTEFQGGIQTTSASFSSVEKQSLSEFHIFGSPQVLTETPLLAGQTSLELSLNGTMSSDNQEMGLAYIANKQGVQKKFRIGDKVFELATLSEIHADHVILSRNGRDERLALSENRSAVTTTVSRSEIEEKNAAKQNKLLKHLKGPQNQNWQQIMNQQQFDPSKISSIVSNVNIMTDQAGQVRGLKVSNLAQGDMLTKAGLRSNDVITAVNGNPVNAGNMLSIKKTLEQNPNATVTIKRNGKVQNIQVNLSDL